MASRSSPGQVREIGSITNAQAVSHHNVFCFSPHSLHLYCTRTWPGGANTRFSAPHFPHFASMRVCPCLTLTVFRSNASFTKRSISSRIACFDISRLASIPKSLTCGRGRWQRSRPGPRRKAVVQQPELTSALKAVLPDDHRVRRNEIIVAEVDLAFALRRSRSRHRGCDKAFPRGGALRSKAVPFPVRRQYAWPRLNEVNVVARNRALTRHAKLNGGAGSRRHLLMQ